MPQVSTYIRFNKTCREAMAFYQRVLGGTLSMQVVGETPLAQQMPAALHDNILHAELRGDGFALMGSDMSGPEGIIMGTAFSVVLVCATKTEIETLFAQLARVVR